MLKGWSLIGDALSHSVVPGVAGAFMLGLPFSLGAFIANGLAAGAMLFLSGRSGLKIDVIIGIIFTSFFGLGLFMVSISPMSVSIHTMAMGNMPGDHAHRHLSASGERSGFAGNPPREVEGPDGGVLRPEPRARHRPAA